MEKIRGFEIVEKGFNDDKMIQGVLLPRRSTEYSAGYDFLCPYTVTIKSKEMVKIKTYIKAYMLHDEFLELHMRSSLAIKKNLRLKNLMPIIDADYYNNPDNEGNIYIFIVNEGDEEVTIERDEKYVQGIFKKFLIVDFDCPEKMTRIGGLGSTNQEI